MLVVVGLAVLVSTGLDAVRVAADPVDVDFGDVTGSIDAAAVGVGISTYGASPLGDARQAEVERALDARAVRIPVAVRGGVITSGAEGAGDVDVVSLVRTYRSWGWDVLVVIAGGTDDVDVAPGDTTRIVAALGYGDGVEYSTSNEPGNAGRDIGDVVAQARMIVDEGRAVDPAFRVWGPVWSTWDRNAFTALADALGPALAGVDYHRYAMGERAVDTATAMAATRQIGDEVRTTRADLAATGDDHAVAVDELNLSWRYENGVPGGDGRFFTSAATAWIASACGHVLVAGGRCLPYAMQNGPLGMTVEADTPNPDGRPVSSPMPAYWGVAAWTGASRFPHAAGDVYRTRSTTAGLEVYAVANEDGGRNVVLVNTLTDAATAVDLDLAGIAGGRYRLFAGDPTRPYDPPAETDGRYGARVAVTLPALSVATVVLEPDAS